MKLILYSIVFLTMSGCCLMGGKCEEPNMDQYFRILDYTSGQDLVFGPFKKYQEDSIQFFSVMGTDTIHHYYRPALNRYNGTDSVLVVQIISAGSPLVFIRLNDSDIDTLQLNYSMQDGGRCCGDYPRINSVIYNNDFVNRMDGLLYKKKN